jgi:hypothetical protein
MQLKERMSRIQNAPKPRSIMLRLIETVMLTI